jgi:hypothetical protein
VLGAAEFTTCFRRRYAHVTVGGHDVIGFTCDWEDDMGPDTPGHAGTATTLQAEACDKCGTRMDLQAASHGFERWTCPWCRQVIGIDRDPEVGSRFQLARGQPWNYSSDVLQN